MKDITRKTTIEELAAIVSAALEKNGISAVLTGGSVVSIYTDNEYQSRDLDFIRASSQKKISTVMGELGFERKGKDFIPPPRGSPSSSLPRRLRLEIANRSKPKVKSP